MILNFRLRQIYELCDDAEANGKWQRPYNLWPNVINHQQIFESYHFMFCKYNYIGVHCSLRQSKTMAGNEEMLVSFCTLWHLDSGQALEQPVQKLVIFICHIHSSKYFWAGSCSSTEFAIFNIWHIHLFTISFLS